jgi:prophage tail gpP-like protein
LETENAHLRKLLLIPDELFKEDPEETKKNEALKKKQMLKSIDEKLKQAEKKIAKKQTAAELYMQNQRENGFDPFELD